MFDEPKPFGGSSFRDPPVFRSLLSDSNAGRDALSETVQERMWVKKWSVSARNWFNLEVLGFADTSKVVSGLEGFLFTKKSFRRFSCDFPAISAQEIEPFESAMALAESSQSKLLLTVPPNKATVHTEKLGGRAALYSQCYFQRSREQRAAYSRAAGRLYVDHLPSVQRLISTSGEGYYQGDTHWQPHMGLAVIQDLYLALHGSDPGFMQLPVEYQKTRYGGDLERQLLITRSDRAMRPNVRALEAHLLKLEKIPQKTVILHDSFYKNRKGLISKIFDQVIFIHLDDAMAAISESGEKRSEFFSVVENAEYIVVSVAERNVRSRLRSISPFLQEEMARRKAVSQQ